MTNLLKKIYEVFVKTVLIRDSGFYHLSIPISKGAVSFYQQNVEVVNLTSKVVSIKIKHDSELDIPPIIHLNESLKQCDLEDNFIKLDKFYPKDSLKILFNSKKNPNIKTFEIIIDGRSINVEQIKKNTLLRDVASINKPLSLLLGVLILFFVINAVGFTLEVGSRIQDQKTIREMTYESHPTSYPACWSYLLDDKKVSFEEKIKKFELEENKVYRNHILKKNSVKTLDELARIKRPLLCDREGNPRRWYDPFVQIYYYLNN